MKQHTLGTILSAGLVKCDIIVLYESSAWDQGTDILERGMLYIGQLMAQSQRCQWFVTVKLAVSCKLGAAWQLCEGLGPKYCHFYPVIVWALTN